MQLELEIYRARNGQEPFRTWYASLAADRRAFDAVTQRRLVDYRVRHRGKDN